MKQDACIMTEENPECYVALTRTKDWRFVCLNSSSKTSSQVSVLQSEAVVLIGMPSAFCLADRHLFHSTQWGPGALHACCILSRQAAIPVIYLLTHSDDADLSPGCQHPRCRAGPG